MKCPKCQGKCRKTVDSPVWIEQCAFYCEPCDCWFTTWQQSEIESIRQALIDERNTVLALSRKCSQLESDREYNARLCEKKDAELAALKEENERLRSGLEKLEWSDVQWDSQFCPVCTMEPHEGHNLDCWLSKLIKGDSNDSSPQL